MRLRSAELKRKISSFIDRYYHEHSSTPSVNELAQGVGMAKTTAYRYLVEMNERGELRYDGAARTIVTDTIRRYSPVHH